MTARSIDVNVMAYLTRQDMGIDLAEKPRILIVDDEVGASEVLADYLQWHDFEVITRTSGAEALGLLEKEAVDLVISDVDMPKMKGTELLRQIREQWPKLPVILITGNPSIDVAVTSLRLGAVDFVTKPFDLNHLRHIVEKCFPERAENAVDRTLVMEHQERVIGGYEVVRTISEGNMGIVYEARRNGQRYAMKLIRPPLDGADLRREQVERFVREAELASRIEHPNIVRIHDFGLSEEELVPFIVMEYIDGLPLDVHSHRFPKQEYARRAALLAQICDALSCIHQAGICHRDIKPSNILVLDDDTAKVTDFGVARAPDSDLTMHDQLLGSPLYMAPESFISAHVDARADIFSFGSMAYEFLLDEIPFEGENITQVAARICEARPINPRRHDRTFPRELMEILARTLKKNPDERYQDAAAVASELRAYVHHEGRWQERLIKLGQTPIFSSSDWA